MIYSPFWARVEDFQSLIGAGVSLLAVAGAVFGIFLKTRLDERSAARKARAERRAKAASIWLWIDIEGKMPKGGLLRRPTKSEVAAMLLNPIGTSIGASKVIEFHTNMTAGLAAYPHPIADRASFISWSSARSVLAIAQVGNAVESEREALAQKYAEEVALLLRAGIQVIDELSRELDIYRQKPEEYEEAWAKNKRVRINVRGNDVYSSPFDAVGVYETVCWAARREEELEASTKAAR